VREMRLMSGKEADMNLVVHLSVVQSSLVRVAFGVHCLVFA